MRRLHWLVFAAMLMSNLLAAALAGGMARLLYDKPVRKALEVTEYDEGGGVLYNTSAEPLRDRGRRGHHHRHHDRSLMTVEVGDGRTWVFSFPRPGKGPEPSMALGIALLVLGLGSLVVSRRITRRLDELERTALRWGEGELDARAHVSGKDEVANLGRAFNRAADRVEELVQAQRRVLASASHELRSPMARIRMALALLDDGDADRARHLRAAEQDLEELDATVGDLLRVGRMQALAGPEDPEPVEMSELFTDFSDVRVTGSCTVHGDRRLLARLVRNLVENARKHGAPPIEATLSPGQLIVRDHGSGVPPDEREAIFEPFHRPTGHAEGIDGGVGLGLFLVREVAGFHGGTVRVEEATGGGAQFVVSCPQSEPQ